jgi:predicted ATPase/class 3 adenylate cyclase
MVSSKALPEGTVTFFFSDIEGSTKLASGLGSVWPTALGRHGALIRDSVRASGGIEVSTEGDAFFCVFTDPSSALTAAETVQRAVAAEPWPADARIRVRIGLHTGTGTRGGDNYVGVGVHVAARIGAAGHGGQVLVSEATRHLISPHLMERLELRDLGEHRLKGVDRPVRLFQVVIEGLPNTFAPLRTMTAPMRLPAPLTSFVGRERQVADVASLVGQARLVTLTGPGGTGKTRLAIAVAATVAGTFDDGVFFVDLAAITDPIMLARSIVEALGAPPGTGPPLDRLKDFVGERSLLLVLDNFEQILEAGPVVVDLLAAAPRLKVLITSRSPLRVNGEHEIPVDPLEMPDRRRLPEVKTLGAMGSVALFVDRAQAINRTFRLDDSNRQAVAEVVSSLDGLPLAIELAATRVRLLSVEDIAERLRNRLGVLIGGGRDLPTRQQTMWAAIDWSYGLLTAPTQQLFGRLGVFVGGFDLDQAEAVCADDLEGDFLDELSILVEHSLVQRQELATGVRFRLLETVREFALERLEELGEAYLIRAKHARVYLDVAEEAAPHLLGSEQGKWLDRLERDHDNLRAALSWAIGDDASELADRLLWSLWRLWQMRGHLDEGGRRAEAVLVLPMKDPETRVRALEAAGGVAYWQGEMEKALGIWRVALELAREVGDQPLVADALYNLAYGLAFAESDRLGGRAALEEAEAIYQNLADRAGEAKALFGVATMVGEGGTTADYEEAVPLYRKLVSISRELDDRFQLGYAERMLGRTLLNLGETGEARGHLREATRLFHTAHDLSAVTLLLTDFTLEAVLLGEDERAVRLLGAMQAMRENTGAGIVGFRSQHVEGLDDVLDRMGNRTTALLAEGAEMGYDDLVAFMVGEDVIEQAGSRPGV